MELVNGGVYIEGGGRKSEGKRVVFRRVTKKYDDIVVHFGVA